jgi:hypothetical protein
MQLFTLRMVKNRTTGIQFQVAAPVLFCHHDQTVPEANTTFYIMDAGGSFPLSKLAKTLASNHEVLPLHAHYSVSRHGDNNQTSESRTADNSAMSCLHWH